MKYDIDDFRGYPQIKVDNRKAIIGLETLCDSLEVLKNSGFKPCCFLLVDDNVGTYLCDVDKYFRKDENMAEGRRGWYKGDNGKFLKECLMPMCDNLKAVTNSCEMEETISKIKDLQETLEEIEKLEDDCHFVISEADGAFCDYDELYSSKSTDKDGITTVIGFFID